MLCFNLNNSASNVRIWFEPKKNFFYNQYQRSEVYNFECFQNQRLQDKTIILEINIYAGGRYMYGLLGFNYHFLNNNKLEAKINLTKKNIKTSEDTLIKSESAYLGLPEEYSIALYKGLKKAHDENKLLLSGKVDFCYAAHGLVSSCILIFQKLTYLLVNLISFEEKDVTRDIFFEMLKKANIDNY
jgi:hypothetical protein